MESNTTLYDLRRFPVTKLKDLARKYNVENYTKYNSKNKSKLADLIFEKIKHKKAPSYAFKSGKQCETSKIYKKTHVVQVAKDLGIETKNKKRQDLCKEIMKKIKIRKSRSRSRSRSRSISRSRSTPSKKRKKSPRKAYKKRSYTSRSRSRSKPRSRSRSRSRGRKFFPVVRDNRDQICYDNKPKSHFLNNETIRSLKNIFASQNITKGLPTLKEDLVDTLCDLGIYGTCDPENNRFCDGHLYCDVSNRPGICVSENRRNGETINIGNKNFVGLRKDIKKLDREAILKKFLEIKTGVPPIATKPISEVTPPTPFVSTRTIIPPTRVIPTTKPPVGIIPPTRVIPTTKPPVVITPPTPEVPTTKPPVVTTPPRTTHKRYSLATETSYTDPKTKMNLIENTKDELKQIVNESIKQNQTVEVVIVPPSEVPDVEMEPLQKHVILQSIDDINDHIINPLLSAGVGILVTPLEANKMYKGGLDIIQTVSKQRVSGRTFKIPGFKFQTKDLKRKLEKEFETVIDDERKQRELEQKQAELKRQEQEQEQEQMRLLNLQSILKNIPIYRKPPFIPAEPTARRL